MIKRIFVETMLICVSFAWAQAITKATASNVQRAVIAVDDGNSVEAVFAPSNSKVTEKGDTLFESPSIHPVAISSYSPNQSSTNRVHNSPPGDFGPLWLNYNMNISQSPYSKAHPALGKSSGSAADLYCALENYDPLYGGCCISVMRSTDHGVSWNYFGFFYYSYADPIQFPEVGVTDSYVIITCHEHATNQSWIARSPLGSNANWYYNLLDAQTNVMEPDIVGVSGNTFYAVATYYYTTSNTDIRFYKTTNAGVNWAQTTLIGGGSDNRMHFMSRIAVDDNNSNHIGVAWMTGNDSIGVALSANGGSSWSTAHFRGQNTHGIPRYPKIAINGNTVVVLHDNDPYLGIIWTTNYGASWSDQYFQTITGVAYPAITSSTHMGVTLAGAWADQTAGNTKSMWCYYSDPTTWYGLQSVTIPGGTASVEPPAICLNGFGLDSMCVAWRDSRDNYDIWGNTQVNRNGVQEPALVATVHKTFGLNQNQPNPVNNKTQIEYSLPEPCLVELNIFDVNGRKISTLVNGNQSAGPHQVVWVLPNKSEQMLPNGVYFYRLQAGNRAETKRLIVLR